MQNSCTFLFYLYTAKLWFFFSMSFYYLLPPSFFKVKREKANNSQWLLLLYCCHNSPVFCLFTLLKRNQLKLLLQKQKYPSLTQHFLHNAKMSNKVSFDMIHEIQRHSTVCVWRMIKKWNIFFCPELQEPIFKLTWSNIFGCLPTTSVAAWFNINTPHKNFTACYTK